MQISLFRLGSTTKSALRTSPPAESGRGFSPGNRQWIRSQGKFEMKTFPSRTAKEPPLHSLTRVRASRGTGVDVSKRPSSSTRATTLRPPLSGRRSRAWSSLPFTKKWLFQCRALAATGLALMGEHQLPCEAVVYCAIHSSIGRQTAALAWEFSLESFRFVCPRGAGYLPGR